MWIPDESQLLRCEFRMKVNSKQFTATFNVGNKIQITSPSKTKLTFTIKTISNKRKIARTVVWALGTSARCIRMAFVHFHRMGLAAFVKRELNWKRTYIVKKKLLKTWSDKVREKYTTPAEVNISFLLIIFTFPFPPLFFFNFRIFRKSH